MPAADGAKPAIRQAGKEAVWERRNVVAGAIVRFSLPSKRQSESPPPVTASPHLA